MKTIEIDISDYLQESEIKEIVIDEYKYALRNKLKDEKEITRIIGNTWHQEFHTMLDEIVPNYKQTIVENVAKLINEESSNYSVFRAKTNWNDASIATKIVEETVKANKDILVEKVKEVMRTKDFSKEIIDQIGCVIDEMYNYNNNVIAKIHTIFCDLKGK